MHDPAYPVRTQRCDSVDYDSLANAVTAARAKHPDATSCVARMHAGEIYVEVWTNGHATTWFPSALEVLG